MRSCSCPPVDVATVEGTASRAAVSIGAGVDYKRPPARSCSMWVVRLVWLVLLVKSPERCTEKRSEIQHFSAGPLIRIHINDTALAYIMT